MYMLLLMVQLVVDEVVCVFLFGQTCRIKELGEKVLVHCALLLCSIQLGTSCDLVFET